MNYGKLWPEPSATSEWRTSGSEGVLMTAGGESSSPARWMWPTPCLSLPGVERTLRSRARAPLTGSVTYSAVTGRRTVPGCRDRQSPGTKLKEKFSLPVQHFLHFFNIFPSTLLLLENTKSRLYFGDDNYNYCGTNYYHDNH